MVNGHNWSYEQRPVITVFSCKLNVTNSSKASHQLSGGKLMTATCMLPCHCFVQQLRTYRQGVATLYVRQANLDQSLEWTRFAICAAQNTNPGISTPNCLANLCSTYLKTKLLQQNWMNQEVRQSVLISTNFLTLFEIIKNFLSSGWISHCAYIRRVINRW